MFKLLKFLGIAIVIISSVVFLTLSFAPDIEGYVMDNSEIIDSTITPARDLSGQWSGTAQFQEDVEGAECYFAGNFELTLQQQNDQIQGYFIFTETSFRQVKKPSNSPIPPIGCSGPVDDITQNRLIGTVSSSSLNFEEFSGSFTTDLLTLTPKTCIVQFGEECEIVSGSVKLNRI